MTLWVPADNTAPTGTQLTTWYSSLAALEGERPVFVRKTADETVNNSATLQDDDALTIALAANTVYEFRQWITQNSNATANFKLSYTTPAGMTFLWGMFDCGSSAANEQFGLLSSLALTGITGAAADSVCKIEALILTSSAGNLTLQWAQNTANASNTTVKLGSSICARRVATV